MKRRAALRWTRGGLQLGAAAAVGLAYSLAPKADAVAQGGECTAEDDCSFNKPNILLVLDYSSSMRKAFANETESPVGERWQGAEDAVRSVIAAQNGFFDENMHLAMMRFGSAQVSPSPTCGFAAGEATKVDVPWYDLDGPNYDYTECNGEAITTALDAISYPGSQTGCATWTKAALEKARELIDDARTRHAESTDEMDDAYRYYGVILMTDGAWNGPGGDSPRVPEDDPAPVAADLYGNMSVPVYVVALTTQAALIADADSIASMGGTMASIDGSDPTKLETSLQTIIDDISDNIIVPRCTEGQPRVMIVLDASSSMLNVGMDAGTMGMTGWDQARAALAGATSIFDVEVNDGANVAEDLMQLGLIAFGGATKEIECSTPDCCTDLCNDSNLAVDFCNGAMCAGAMPTPAEEKLLVQYGPCMKDNFAWALDPATSCDAPGCTDPWGGAGKVMDQEIVWTFKSSPPSTANGLTQPFAITTRSHMPRCKYFDNYGCSGSATFTHRGLLAAWDNIRAIQADPGPFPVDVNTQFINILITDGDYTRFSTHTQVRSALETMYANDVTTYVIGFGEIPSEALLSDMASWGSGATQAHFSAGNQAELETALATILENVNFDPCCTFNDCSMEPEPDWDTDQDYGASNGEIPPMDTDRGDSATTTDSSSESGSGGATDSDGDTGASASASASGSATDSTSSEGSGSDSDSASGTDSTGSASASATMGTTTTASSGTASTTASGTDSDTDGDTGDSEGCGCRSGNGGAPVGLVGFALLALAQRRRRQ